jgi:multiple sugar transport system substrate-binding protein
MTEIKISINSIDQYDPHKLHFQALLDEFNTKNKKHVALQVYTWGVAWNEFIKISLYGTGPIISQTGDSWMGSLIGRNSLQSSWQSCLDFNNKDVVAVPWILDTYLIYYHRDMLEKAGVDVATAFTTFENLNATLEKLRASGISYPLAMATNWSHSNIHLLSSWVWGYGGDFTNAEGTQVLFNQPETHKGIKMYFDLFRFISPDMQPITDQECLPLFLDKKVAITMRNPGILFQLKNKEFPEAFSTNVGTAVMPGIPWVGGSHLVVWKHIRYEQEQDALNLIKFLTSAEAGLATFDATGLLPANLDALNQIDSASIFTPAIESVKKGRVFRRLRMWGLVEEKLALAMMKIWSTLYSTPNPDVDKIITENLDAIAAKINLSLAQ